MSIHHGVIKTGAESHKQSGRVAGSKTIVFKGTKIRKSTTLNSHAMSILLMITDEMRFLFFHEHKSIPPPLLYNPRCHHKQCFNVPPLFLAAFVVQFLLLSLCFGIPLLTFFISCGQYLGSGLIDMWRVSPIFQVRPQILSPGQGSQKGISEQPLVRFYRVN